MSILPGFQKYKRHIRIGDDYILDSEWTHAETVEMSDGSTLDDTVANINREITATKKSVSDGKSAVASAITEQGVTTAADATFDVMAANIGKVGTDKYNTGYNAGVAATKVGTATAAQVLSGKTFTNASSVGLTGTMADYSANPQTVTLSSSQTGTSTLSLSAGYHSSVKVNAANVYSAGISAGHKMITGSFTITPTGGGGGIPHTKEISFGSIFGTSVPNFGIAITIDYEYTSYTSIPRYRVISVTATIQYCEASSGNWTATWVAAL